jgi:hypothetical protein
MDGIQTNKLDAVRASINANAMLLKGFWCSWRSTQA